MNLICRTGSQQVIERIMLSQRQTQLICLRSRLDFCFLLAQSTNHYGNNLLREQKDGVRLIVSSASPSAQNMIHESFSISDYEHPVFLNLASRSQWLIPSVLKTLEFQKPQKKQTAHALLQKHATSIFARSALYVRRQVKNRCSVRQLVSQSVSQLVSQSVRILVIFTKRI